MKFNSIKVREIRGIRQFDRSPTKNNLVICGENGTGKSGLIDAIDFLLTGKIRRLSGEGTGEISLEEHGKHILGKPEEAFVEANISIGSSEAVKLKRTILEKKLEVEGASTIDSAALVDSIKDGQFALTRKELLKFIACDGSTRSQQVQSLLDIQNLDKIRTSLNQAVTFLEKKQRELTAVCENNERQIDASLSLRRATWSERLVKINEVRKKLGATPFESLQDKMEFDNGLVPERRSTSFTQKELNCKLSTVNASNFKDDLDYDKIEKQIKEVFARPEILREIKSLKLIELGIAVAADDKCPLCDNSWNLAELKEHLQEKVRRSKESKTLKRSLDNDLNVLKIALTGQKKATEDLQKNLLNIQKNYIAKKLSDSIDTITENLTLIEKQNLEELLPAIEKKSVLFEVEQQVWFEDIKSLEKELPEQDDSSTLFNALTELKRPYASYIENKSTLAKVEKRLLNVKRVRSRFDKAKLSYLENLYKEIEFDFSQFYSQVNPEDESNFPVELSPVGPSLKLNVGFHGQGMHPPNALHSEGHQDIMGVCLYLALMKKLKGPYFTFCMLDDVMMSIDTDHRRKLCRLLSNHFKDTQFFITTHDRLWAEQLREFGVTNRENLIFFRSWALEHGPVFDNKDVWTYIIDNTDKSTTVETGASLRRVCEHEFSEICSNLRAPIQYKNSQTWTLGDFRPPAYSKFSKLLKKALTANQKWKNSDKCKILDEKIIQLRQAEENAKINWQTNKAIHFSKWGELTRGELKETVEAMHQLLQSFRCDKCDSFINTVIPADKHAPSSLGCTCGKYNITIQK